ncbi:hypothetical protein R83H12_00300 [Fibrobacteria bacterium R8-3-H12]
MNKFFVLSTIAFSIFFFGCEEDAIPIPLPPSQPAADAPVEESAGKAESQVPAKKPGESAKTVKNQAKASAPAKEPAKTIAYFDGDAEQLSTGRYIVQVGIFPVETSAKKLIKKLAENGIKAYNAKVQNPDPEKGMIGTYNRVRIGFFDAKTAAEAFAKARLEPLGYTWWIDRSKNDNIGKLVSSESEPFFEVERIPEQMSEQERRDAERAAAIAAAKEEYKAIAKAANASASIPPPKIPDKAPKAVPPPAPKAPPPKLAPPPKAPPPTAKAAPPTVSKTPSTTKEAEIDSRGKVKMKSRRGDS